MSVNVLLSLSVLSHVFGALDKTSSLVFQCTVKMGNFIIIIIIIIMLL